MSATGRDDVVLALADATGALADRVGAKAARLARLAASGFAVPPGFVVTGAGDELADQELRAVIEDALAAQPELGSGPFAVRSSAVAEDL
ncbi:MAG: pyruvate, phosphate dikinase, partial [Pseudonocardiaceae bacterium]|nr:pyruvate, phosphate dikinase [Pseudonocardiaceae bacterium]